MLAVGTIAKTKFDKYSLPSDNTRKRNWDVMFRTVVAHKLIIYKSKIEFALTKTKKL